MNLSSNIPWRRRDIDLGRVFNRWLMHHAVTYRVIYGGHDGCTARDFRYVDFEAKRVNYLNYLKKNWRKCYKILIDLDSFGDF